MYWRNKVYVAYESPFGGWDYDYAFDSALDLYLGSDRKLSFSRKRYGPITVQCHKNNKSETLKIAF